MTGSPVLRLLGPAGGGPLDRATIADLYGRPPQPTLRVNFVSSLDGAVEVQGHSAGLSGPADKLVFGVLRMLCDALLVAAGTLRREGYRALRLDDSRRAWRLGHGLAEHPTLVVVSAALDLDPAAPVFTEAPVRPVVLTSRRATAPAGLSRVAELLRCGQDRVDLAAGVAELRRRGLAQVLCEGGPRLFGSLTAAGLVDEVCLTVAPLLAGPGADRITTGTPTAVRAMTLRHVLASDDGMLMLRYGSPG